MRIRMIIPTIKTFSTFPKKKKKMEEKSFSFLEMQEKVNSKQFSRKYKIDNQYTQLVLIKFFDIDIFQILSPITSKL